MTRTPPLTSAQRELIALMQSGRSLMWFGSAGPELAGRPFWPQKRTVRALIARGVLRWGDYANETHRKAGFIPVLLSVAK